jgi:hypothetical protein
VRSAAAAAKPRRSDIEHALPVHHASDAIPPSVVRRDDILDLDHPLAAIDYAFSSSQDRAYPLPVDHWIGPYNHIKITSIDGY